MRKIPTLFKREFLDHKVVNILPEVTPGFEWVLNGEGRATLKLDGACCAIIDGELYKRYDAKRGKTPPAGALPCEPVPDPVTGHWPFWVKCDENNPSDKWFIAAYQRFVRSYRLSHTGTYEAVGPHFNGNPYGIQCDRLIPHGATLIKDFPRDFDGMREYLRLHEMEGVVFWKEGEPQCKIKRTDFGFEWPIKKEAPMHNMMFNAKFINHIEEGTITIYYYGGGFQGKISIYINEFFPCADSRLRKLLKEYREPLGGEYTALCWSLYHWLEDLSKYCGARGKAYGNRVLKNMDVLAKELGIQ